MFANAYDPPTAKGHNNDDSDQTSFKTLTQQFSHRTARTKQRGQRPDKALNGYVRAHAFSCLLDERRH